MMMLFMMLVSPFVSFMLIYPAKRRLDVTVEIPSKDLERGSELTVAVTLKNNTVFPVPFVDLSFFHTYGIEPVDSINQRVSIGPMRETVLYYRYVARSRGTGTVGVDKIVVADFLGLFRLPVKKDENKDYSLLATVLPCVCNIRSDSRILMQGNTSEAAEEIGAASGDNTYWFGEPGFEVREYVPGDSMRKVHWKLSARKDAFFVRKDEARGMSKKRLIVDPHIHPSKVDSSQGGIFKKAREKQNDEDKAKIIEDRVLEAFISVANALIKSGRDVEAWLYEYGAWQRYILSDIKDIVMLQHKLSEYGFETKNDVSRIPQEEIIEISGRAGSEIELTVFTGSYDEALINAANRIRGCVNFVAVSDRDLPAAASPIKDGELLMLDIKTNISEAFV